MQNTLINPVGIKVHFPLNLLDYLSFACGLGILVLSKQTSNFTNIFINGFLHKTKAN